MRRSLRSPVAAVAAAAALFAGGSSAALLLAPPAALADELDDALAALRDTVKEGDEGKIVSAIGTFEKRRDKRIDAELLPLARGTKMTRVAKEAMRVLAIHRDPGYLGWVKSRLYARKLETSDMDLYTAMLDSLPPAGDSLKPYVKDLGACFREYLKSRPEVTTRVAAAFARIHDESAILTLISLLEETEETPGTSGGRGGLTQPPPLSGSVGSGTNVSGNLDQAREAVTASLKELTSADAGNSLKWKVWWRENEKTFRFKATEPDWPTLTQFEETYFGFTLKKPSGGKDWTFARSAFGGGVAALRLRDGATVNAAADLITLAMEPYADAEEYAKFFEERWRGVEFSEFAAGGEPAVSEKRIGGRVFAVLRAKGTAADAWKDWNVCERRCYVTIVEPGTFLVVESAVRDGLDEATASALWSSIESMTFKRPR